MNPYDGYVQIPFDLAMPGSWELVFTIAFGSLFVGSLIYAGYLYYKERDPAVIMVIIGAGVCSLAEPIVDILGMCIHAINGQQFTVFTTFGRPMPIYVPLCYVFFFGAMVLVVVRKFQKGITSATLWKVYIASAVIEFCLEPVALHLGVWGYYGNQPFTFFLFPMWWPPVNALGVIVIATLVYFIRPHLKGISLLVLIPLIISGDLMANVAIAWPMYSALHSGMGYAVTYAAAIVTMALCAVVIHIIGRLVATVPA